MEIMQASGDIRQIMLLVDDVFTGEQGIPQWMNPIPPEKQPVWWCICAEGKVIAAAALYRADGEWHMGRIAVAKEFRGRGIGTQLLRHGLSEAFAMGADAVHMEARDATVRILRKMGGEVVGEPAAFYGGNVTPVVVRRDEFVSEP